jgi:hypothetical protein
VDTGFPKKIMLKQSDKAGRRFEEKSSRFSRSSEENRDRAAS